MSNADSDHHFGMKRLNPQNWTVPDVPKFFRIEDHVWIREIMREQLIDEVPEEVRRMFEVARGAIAYGWFFYPLLTLASEQLPRIGEAAVKKKCEQLGIPLMKMRGGKSLDRGFKELLDELIKSGHIAEDAADEWDATRALRNITSHPSRQMILPPGHAIASIHASALRINQLFAPRPDEYTRLALQVRKSTGFDNPERKFPVVAGVDVGGAVKGFHVVILKNRQIESFVQCDTPEAVREQCNRHGVDIVAVDAPCGWSGGDDPRAREAEQVLSAMGMHSFRTPTRELAATNPFYSWMFNGETLYADLRKEFPLFDHTDDVAGKKTCFETYPYAASLALSGRRLKAADKQEDRRRLLRAAGLDESKLRNIDFVDAAICALVACAFSADLVTIAGNKEEGFIVLPH